MGRIRTRLVLALVPFVLAGCAGAPGADPSTADAETSMLASPEPVEIHDVVNLVQGGEQTWTFEAGPGATSVEMRFFATGKAVAGTGLPTCLTFETPEGPGAAGSCQSGVGNVNVVASVVLTERVFYEDSGADAPIGTYTFTLDAGPSATDFHALVTVSYD